MGGLSSLISLLCIAAVSVLNVGDAAPSLEGTQWIKGNEPVFQNQVTIVEFWRTTCGSCKAQIPHLTSLQEKYGDQLSIVSVSKYPLEIMEKFVKANEDQMGFSVGKVSEELSDTYMTGVKGVPYAFLINRDGIVVWKGHPANIDDMLAKTIEGNIDIKQLKKIAQLEASLEEALITNDPDIIIPVNQQLLAADTTNERALEIGIKIAIYNGEPEMIREIFDKVQLKGLGGHKANAFAEMLVTGSDLEYRYLEAAIKFSVYALKQEPANDTYMDTYARVLYCLGDIEKAITWEKKALALNPKTSSYQSKLDYYTAIKAIRERSDYNPVTQLEDSKAKK